MKFLEQLKCITDASAGATIKFIKDWIEGIKALAKIAFAFFAIYLVGYAVGSAISLIIKYVF